MVLNIVCGWLLVNVLIVFMGYRWDNRRAKVRLKVEHMPNMHTSVNVGDKYYPYTLH